MSRGSPTEDECAARDSPRRCGPLCSRRTARTWTRRNRIRAPGRSTVTMCSAASSSITLPTDTGSKPRPPGWRDAQAALARSFRAEQASAISSVARACRRNGGTGSQPNATMPCDCVIVFDPVLLVWPRRRACVMLRTSRRFRVCRPMERASRSSQTTRAEDRWDCMSRICRRARLGGLREWTVRMRWRGRQTVARLCCRSSRWWITPACTAICISSMWHPER